MFSATTTYACMLLLVGMPGAVHGWADIAGAPTFKCMHHLFHGCPAFGGWHHAGSVDLVHWDDRGVPIKVLAEAYARTTLLRGVCVQHQFCTCTTEFLQSLKMTSPLPTLCRFLRPVRAGS